MSQIKVLHNPNNISGLAVIEPTVHGDSRGHFIETWNKTDMQSEGLDVDFVQDNQSKSSMGVLRGLHFQKQHPQGKLVRVILGAVYDVAVDLRYSSPTFGKYYSLILSDINNLQFFIPRGFAHGYLVLSDVAVFAYKCTDFYRTNDEGGLAWDDQSINIDWPLERIKGVKLSDKDKRNPTLKEIMARGIKFAF